MKLRESTPDRIPLTHNGQQIGTCYAEMTPQGVRMVAEIDEETEKRLKGELQQRPMGFSIEGHVNIRGIPANVNVEFRDSSERRKRR